MSQLTSFAQKKADSTSYTTNHYSFNLPDTLKVDVHHEDYLFPDSIKIENIKGWDWVEQMPWIVALIIGLISFYFGDRQIKVQRNLKTSEIRQQWIDNVRNSISDYLAKIEHYSVIISAYKDDKEKLKTIVQDPVQQEIYSLINKIVLLLNPNEKPSKDLINNISKYTKSVFGEHEGDLTQEQLKQNILDVTKLILKTEWERVKKGK
jgi:hypothetical protein